ncbi:hypothetical protein C2G38_2161544 [Gigaspora rosea]|uniref:Uncharacterized protein n=1 Tax=Gigaspora rosea TaxID=44941 RepID=A0A397W179_9GLOM|nr:hypothetical protein C2G38_2161544 [Gigaspora rosea]
MSIIKMLIPLDDINSDNESILSSNSFLIKKIFLENNSSNGNDKEKIFLDKNNYFNEKLENFDINDTFEDKLSTKSEKEIAIVYHIGRWETYRFNISDRKVQTNPSKIKIKNLKLWMLNHLK